MWNSEGKQSFRFDNAVFPWCIHWMGKKSPLSLITNVLFISDMIPGVITGFTVVDFLITKFFRLTIDSLHFYPSSVMSTFFFQQGQAVSCHYSNRYRNWYTEVDNSLLFFIMSITFSSVSEGNCVAHFFMGHWYHCNLRVYWFTFFQWFNKPTRYIMLFSCWTGTTDQGLFSLLIIKFCEMLFTRERPKISGRC